MTTGLWVAGDNPGTVTDSKFFSRKYWNGGDGRSITGRFSRKDKWNPYSMGHFKYRMFRNTINLRNKASGSVSTVKAIWPGVANLVPSSAFPSSDFANYWTTNDDYALLAKLLNEVKGHSFNMGVSLAEVDKFAGTISQTVKNLGLFLRDLKRGHFDQAARRLGASKPSSSRVARLRLRDISGRFLEMRYAWEPAINDAFEACKAFEALSNGPRQQQFTAARKRKIPDANSGGNYLLGFYTVEVRRKYTYEMYEELSAARQMGVANPASIVWERIPYSFVIDWFYPVGSYLELISQIPFMKGRWCRTDSIRRTFTGWTDLQPTVAAFNELVGDPAAHEWESFQMRRDVSFSPPNVPRPRLNVFGLKAGKRVYNAIALAHQIVASTDVIYQH